MKYLRAWLAQLFAHKKARICLRCRHWNKVDPGIEPVGTCAFDYRETMYAHETCAKFDKKEARQ
jgi:hypothetical protein